MRALFAMGLVTVVVVASTAVMSAGCGSGACRQSPCVPGVPLLSGTCKCVPNEDGGASLDGGGAEGRAGE